MVQLIFRADIVHARVRACRRPLGLVRGLLLASSLLLGACADTTYYWQSLQGHVQLMHAARPISAVLAQPELSPTLRQRLEVAQTVRDFAVHALALPDNSSYRSYADIGRDFVVWNVVASAADNLKLQTWCFPVMGCVGYKGFYTQVQAQRFAAELQAQGLEVFVYGVPAYSTLGWLNWAGGDPLPSSMTRLPEADMARLIFHELAHQVLYVGSDTVFDESFATAVERLGMQAWLAHRLSPDSQVAYQQSAARRLAFQALTRQTRARLQQVYEQAREQVQPLSMAAAAKAQVMADFRLAYGALKQTWGGYTGFDAWVAQANNAAFAVQAAYDELVPGFEALHRQVGGHWPAFYAAVRAMAALPQPERRQRLQTLAGQFQTVRQ